MSRPARIILPLYVMFIFAYVLGFLVVFVGEAAAQPIFCNRFDSMQRQLKERYGEIDIGGGLVNPQRALRIFAAPDGATFTILSVAPSGLACIVGAGRDLEIAPPPPATEADREG